MTVVELIGIIGGSGIVGVGTTILFLKVTMRNKKAEASKTEAEAQKTVAESNCTEIQNLTSIIQIYKNAESYSQDKLEEAKSTINESIKVITELTSCVDILKIHNNMLRTLIQELTSDNIEDTKRKANEIKL